jgi:hydrogenase expression/formation protein HypC
MCLGVPGRLVERCIVDNSALATGLVEFEGLRRRVCLELVPDAKIGDYVVVHAGIAISHLDVGEAERLLRHLRLLNEMDIPAEAAP